MTDAALGAMVRKESKLISKALLKPQDKQVFFAVGLSLVTFARRMGGTITMNIPNVTDGKTGKPVGNYRITVEEID